MGKQAKKIMVVLGVLVLCGSVWAEDSGLIAHWKFDEGSGTIAYDSAGSNDGIVYGAVWTSGQIDGALSFDGVNDYVNCGTGPPITGTGNFAVSAWVKTDSAAAGVILNQRRISSAHGSYMLSVPATGYVRFAVYNSGYGFNFKSNVKVNDGLWHHIAAVRTNSTDGEIYVDGSLAGSGSGGVKSLENVPVVIGRWNGGGLYFNGIIDDVRIYDRALSPEEIQQLYGEVFGGRAFNPDPADGAIYVDPNVILSWSPGRDAISHNVYFGTDFADVNDATPSSAAYQANVDVNSWDTCGLETGLIYYWRIDEVNDFDANSPWKGNVWSFETARAVIELSKSYFEFMAFENGANPDDQILSIKNSGVGTLNWQISEDCNWLSVEPNSGSSTGEVDDVNLAVDISSLEFGTYDCNVTILGPNAENSPQIVLISLVIGTEGELYVPAQYGRIQAAIDAAVNGNTVVVLPGTYTGEGNRDIDFLGKAITVRSIDPNDPNIVAATIIDCNGTEDDPHRGFYFHSGEG
ncbi:MAG: LamG-like jellyroll fold domain-containing protein, partial [Planctomycetota bacterium]